MAEPLPKMNRCSKCGDWYHNAHACLSSLQWRKPAPAAATHDWKGMDGATAWHLIDRHADGWGDVGAMMEAWRVANLEPK